MDSVSNSKFYESIFHLDPNILAMAKARLNSNDKTTKTSVIQNQSIEENVIEGTSKSFKTNNNTTSNASDYFMLSNNTSYGKVFDCKISEIKADDNDDNRKSCIKNGTIAALCEGRGNAIGEIGLAAIDLASPILYLSQFSDDILYTALINKLQIHTPSELLVPKTLFDSNCKSIEKIRKIFLDLKMTSLPRRHFSEEGLQVLLDCGSLDCKADIKSYEKKYYAISAASALIKYLRAIHSISFFTNGLIIKFDAKLSRMVLDHNTCERLELLRPIFHAKENKACLLDILDKTVTQIGKRQIRAKILEPHLETKDIVLIQQAITELLDSSKSENAIGQISDILKKFYNVDKILKISLNDRVEKDSVKSVQIMLDKILLLKSKLEIVPELGSALKTFKSFNLYKAYTTLMDNRFIDMMKTIEKILRPEANFIRGAVQSFQRIHAIRPGLNEYLDILRESYNNLTDGINENVNHLAAQHGLPLRMTYSAQKGFHIQLVKVKKKSEKLEIPAGFTTICEKSNAIYLTTNEITKANVKLRDTSTEIYICCDKIIKKLTEDLIQYSEANYLLVDIIAKLDIILSYAKVSQTDGFCCPEFGEETRIVEARHIFLENARSSRVCVPNNIIATPEYNIFIITGPNMAGKTVYLKTIALIQIIAQLGCYVPAKCAKFRICDKIFTRLGFDDKIEQDGSGFVNEMREVEYIFKNITSRSLIVIDELCRTTNPSGGFNLAWKLCSKLCQFEQVVLNDLPDQDDMDESDESNLKFLNLPMPHIYISTHFLGLTKLKEKFFNVVNLQVEAEEIVDGNNLSLNYTHKVKEGVTAIKNYGLTLAKLVGIPEEILKDAHDILNDIRMSSIRNEENKLEADVESIEEVEILHKTLDTLFPNKSFEIQHQRDSVISVASFMNNTNYDNIFNRIQKTKSIHTSKELMQEFCFKMYDFYADIATLQRNTPQYKSEEFRIKAKEIYESVKESLPLELQELLAAKDLFSILEESKLKSHTLGKSDENDVLNSLRNQNIPDSSPLALDTDKISKVSNFENIFEYDHQNSDIILESSGRAKVVENIQILPPCESANNKNQMKMTSKLEDVHEKQEKYCHFKKKSYSKTENLNKSLDLKLLRNFDFDQILLQKSNILEVPAKDNEGRQKYNILKPNQTIDLGGIQDSNENSEDLFKD